MVKPKKMQNNVKEPMHFERAYLIGYNENSCSSNQESDLQFYEILKLEAEHKRKIKPPKILSIFENPNLHVRSKDNQLSKQIENIVKAFAMPSGVKYQKYTDITQTLQQVKQNISYQLMQLQKEQENRQSSSEFQDLGDETSPYLVSIIKSDSDPYDESFLLITLVFDFHLIRLDEK